MAFVAGKKGRRYGAAYAAGSWEPDEHAFVPAPYELDAAKVVPRVQAPASTLLDKLFPITINSSGKARIYGLPPVVTYALAAVLVTSGAYHVGRAAS